MDTQKGIGADRITIEVPVLRVETDFEWAAHVMNSRLSAAQDPSEEVRVLSTRPGPTSPALVGAAGFEPATLCSQSRCATRLRYTP